VAKEVIATELSSVAIHMMVLLVTPSAIGTVTLCYSKFLYFEHIAECLLHNESLTETFLLLGSIMLFSGNNSSSRFTGANTHYGTPGHRSMWNSVGTIPYMDCPVDRSCILLPDP